jgi:hypothetical protein
MGEEIIGPSDITGTYSAQSDSDGIAGQPVYVRPNGHIGLAASTDILKAEVAGFLLEDVIANFSGSFIKDGSITLTDWVDIIGTSDLVQGSIYYLDAVPGVLTNIAPTTGGLYVSQVGQAVNTKTLAIEIQNKILL